MAVKESIAVEETQEALVVTILLEHVDYMLIDKLQRRICAQGTMASKSNVILDFRHVGHVSSMLMGALVKMLTKLGQDGRRFSLVGINQRIRGSFKMMRIDTLFEVHETLEDAQSVLAAPQGC